MTGLPSQTHFIVGGPGHSIDYLFLSGLKIVVVIHLKSTFGNNECEPIMDRDAESVIIFLNK